MIGADENKTQMPQTDKWRLAKCALTGGAGGAAAYLCVSVPVVVVLELILISAGLMHSVD